MDNFCAIYVDTGTTNTRVWLVRGGEIVSRSNAMVGVRDTARDGSATRLHESLRDLIAKVSSDPNAKDCNPAYVAAAGMITSSLGLADIPHVIAPAGIDELSASVRRLEFPNITHLPFLLVPGVRTGAPKFDRDQVALSDIMRGEETMCVGLMLLGLAPESSTILNLGSRWRAIGIDADRIIAGVSTLSGEMIHTTQTQTILASSVPQTRPESLDPEWVKAGMSLQRKSGLARALFCVRLLDQGAESTPEQRLAFLIGAFIASDLDALVAGGAMVSPVVITGGGALADAWLMALNEASIAATALRHESTENALLAGLAGITSIRR